MLAARETSHHGRPVITVTLDDGVMTSEMGTASYDQLEAARGHAWSRLEAIDNRVLAIYGIMLHENPSGDASAAVLQSHPHGTELLRLQQAWTIRSALLLAELEVLKLQSKDASFDAQYLGNRIAAHWNL